MIFEKAVIAWIVYFFCKNCLESIADRSSSTVYDILAISATIAMIGSLVSAWLLSINLLLS